jgi:hypothetical protein
MSGMSSADQRGTPAGTLTWESPNREHRRLMIRLVRGSVEIRRREGPVRVEVTRSARLSDPFDAAITVSERTDQILISDRYPLRPCVKPASVMTSSIVTSANPLRLNKRAALLRIR